MGGRQEVAVPLVKNVPDQWGREGCEDDETVCTLNISTYVL